MTFASRFLASSALLAMLAQAWLAVSQSGPAAMRVAVILIAGGIVIWARSARLETAGNAERFLVTLAACVVFWVGALELTLLSSVPMARGYLALLTLAGLHAATLFKAVKRSQETRIGLFGQQILVALTIMLATFTVLETAVRALSPLRTYELVPEDPSAGPCLLRAPDGRLEGVPGCVGNYLHRDFPGLRVELNALGLRDGLDDASPPVAGEVSILVLGDSFAYGMGVELEETFQQLLGDRLRSLGYPARVYGAAMPGAGPAHEHQVLRELGPRLAPDGVVLALFQGNDIQDNWAGLERRRRPGVQQLPGPLSPRRFLASTAGWPFWRTSSSLLQLRRIDGRPTRVLQLGMMDPPSDEIRPMRQALLDEILSIEATCAELGADLLVLIVPGRVQVDPESFASFTARHPGEVYSRTAFHEALVADLRALGLQVVDPLPRLETEARERRACYHREGHWNDRGHAIAAELLDEPLRRLLDARKGAPSNPAEGSPFPPRH